MAKDKIYHVIWYLAPENTIGTEFDDTTKMDHFFSEDIYESEDVFASYIEAKSKSYFFSITFSMKELSDIIGNHDVVIQVGDDNGPICKYHYTKQEIIDEWVKTTL